MSAPRDGRDGASRNSPEEHARERWREDLATLAAIERSQDARFEKRDRLEAALYVQRLFKKARRKPVQRQDIQKRIGERVGRSGFKIDKWMLNVNTERVDEALVNQYKNRSEPQKKRSTYLAIVEVLASILEEDGDQHKVSLLQMTTHWRKAQGAKPQATADIEPAQHLADLLHECARSVAKRCDLASIFVAARRHRLGWRLLLGPTVVESSLDSDESMFDPVVPATRLCLQHGGDLPPYPSLPIARIPFGRLDSTFMIEAAPRPGPEFEGLSVDEETGRPLFRYRAEQGTAIAYWELALCIAPITAMGDVGAVLMETPCVYLSAGTEPRRLLDAHDFEALEIHGPPYRSLAFSALDLGRPLQMRGENGWRRVVGPADANLTGMASYQFVKGVDGRVRDYLPHQEIPHVGFHPVDALHVQVLLADPWHKPIGASNVALVGLDPAPPARIWHPRADSIARHLENALLSGEVEHGLLAWATAYRASLTAYEARWAQEGKIAERMLRDRWRAAEEQADVH